MNTHTTRAASCTGWRRIDKSLLEIVAYDSRLTRADLRTLLLAMRYETSPGEAIRLSARFVAAGIGLSKRSAEAALAHLRALEYLIPVDQDRKTGAKMYRIAEMGTEADADTNKGGTEGEPDTKAEADTDTRAEGDADTAERGTEADADTLPKQTRTPGPKQTRTNRRPPEDLYEDHPPPTPPGGGAAAVSNFQTAVLLRMYSGIRERGLDPGRLARELRTRDGDAGRWLVALDSACKDAKVRVPWAVAEHRMSDVPDAKAKAAQAALNPPRDKKTCRCGHELKQEYAPGSGSTTYLCRHCKIRFPQSLFDAMGAVAVERQKVREAAEAEEEKGGKEVAV